SGSTSNRYRSGHESCGRKRQGSRPSRCVWGLPEAAPEGERCGCTYADDSLGLGLSGARDGGRGRTGGWMSGPANAPDTPIESKRQLVEYIAGGAKPDPADWRIGMEHEKFGF